MRKKVIRYRYNIVKISNHVKENNLEFPLTDKELETFVVDTEKFPETALPIEKGKCYICAKETNWVDRVHYVHICSDECTKAIDKNYEEGVDIIRNEEIYKHLEEVDFNLAADFMDDELPK